MTTWTKELPKVDGYYWYRNPGQEAIITRWCALEFEMFGGAPQDDSVGEWWPIRILPPDEAKAIRDPAELKMDDLRKGPFTIPIGRTPLPQPIQVKIDPNQPHA